LETSDYGGFALVETDISNRAEVDIVVTSLAPALEFLDRTNPPGELLVLSRELKKEKAKTIAEVERVMEEYRKEEHSKAASD
jgi:hypothetical protein